MRDPTGANTMTRRDVLKLAGGTAAGIAVSGAIAAEPGPATKPAGDLREKARRNFKLGIFTSVYAKLPLEEAAKRIRDDGFRVIVSENHFADLHFDPWAPDWDVLKKITGCFERHGLQPVSLFGYYNVIDPLPERLQRGEQRIHLYIENWKRFGTPVISLETGTYNRQSEFADAPENYTEKAFEAVKTAFAKLVRAAEKTGATIAIEPYWRNVIDTAERAERLFREIDSPAFKLAMDPCNYYRKDDLPKMKPMLDDMFRRIGKYVVLAHAKDVKASAEGTDLPAAGRGVMDYPTFLRHLAALDREMPLVIEHLTLDDVPRARDFVIKQMDSI